MSLNDIIEDLQRQLNRLDRRLEGLELVEAAAANVYNVKYYGAKGDNTADDTAAIQAALAAANSAGGGVVEITPGTYKVGGTLVVNSGVQAWLHPSAVLKATADVNVVQLKSQSGIFGGAIDVSGVAFTSAAIYLNGADHIGGAFRPTFIQNIKLASAIVSGHGRGYGILLRATQTTGVNPEIYGVQVSNSQLDSFLNGISLEIVETNGVTDWAAVNGNLFSNLGLSSCDNFINVKSVVSGTTTNQSPGGNVFNNIQVQHSANSVNGIFCNGLQNSFTNCFIWDWPGAATGIVCPSRTWYSGLNYFEHNLYPWQVDDQGWRNTFESPNNYHPMFRGWSPPNASGSTWTHAGDQDDILCNADQRYTVTQPAGSAPISGVIANCFRTALRYAGWNSTSTYPVTILVDLGSDILDDVITGISFLDQGYLALNVKIEAYKLSNTTWYTLIDITNNKKDMVHGSTQELGTGISGITKLRYTFSGTQPTWGDLIYIGRIWAFASNRTGHTWLPREGGSIYGNLRLTGNLGVGNSAAATGPVGTIVKKIEVFDAAGTSLGFIAVYNSIP